MIEVSETPAPLDQPPPRRPGWFKRSPRWRKVLVVVGIVVAVSTIAAAGAAYGLVHRYENRVTYEDILGDAAPPPKAEEHWDAKPVNLLLLGSDSREGEADQGKYPGQRSDTIMIVHISATRDKAALISVPRDSYVNVPAGGSWKGGLNKLNAAFAFGGAPLAAKAITQLTGVTFDGAVIANFAGIRTMVDAVDGVNVCLPYDVRSTFSSRFWAKGCHDFSGDEAEEFMRQRKNVPGGDFGRMHDQQLVVQAIVEKVSSGGLLTNPLRLDKLLITAASSLTIDKSLDLRQLASTVKDIPPAAIKYATVPYSNPGLKTWAGSAVQIDEPKAESMFAALRADTVDQWLIDHPPKKPTA